MGTIETGTIMDTRYDRQVRLQGFGEGKQEQLGRSSALVVGAGGLGVPVMQYLVGMGIGKLGIVDQDTIDITNIHRQVLYTPADAGKQKARVAAAKLSAMNELVDITVYEEFLQPGNALKIMADYDLVIDCSDNFGTRYLVNDACVILKKPFIYGAIYQFEGQVSVFNYKGSATYRCLFPEAPNDGEMLNCSEMGVLGILPGMIGTYQANEAVKVLCDIGEPLSNKILTIDTLTNEHRIFKFKPVSGHHDIRELQKDYQQNVCIMETGVQEMDVSKLAEWLSAADPLQLIDVREPDEWDICHLEQARLIPMHTVAGQIDSLQKDIPIALMCHHGMRSRAVANFLVEAGFKNIYNVTGGIHAWAVKVDPNMRRY